MTDIVADLRHLGEKRRQAISSEAGTTEEFIPCNWIIEWRAADEIERLREDLLRYGDHDVNCTVGDPCCSYICDCGFGEAIAEDK